MTTRCAIARSLFALAAAALLLPAAAHAQGAASITGVVKDTSGAVLPGVTVEAASPVLIEKTRTVVSDSGGIYRIVDLRPGAYTVTFTLPGFSTFKREGIELSGNFTATINAEMKVGGLEETITVSGEAPVVDVQGVARQRVLSNETIDAVPTGKNYTNIGVLVPGVSAQCAQTSSAGSQDVGGANGDARNTLVVHGSRFRDQRIAINGMTLAGSTGGLTMTGPNMEAMQEVQLETTSGDASTSTGGVRINVVPKDGGNKFAGGLFLSGTSSKFQGNNVTADLTARGLSAGGISRIDRIYDVAPTFGGPIAKDKLWFFVNARFQGSRTFVGNLFVNRNAGNPNAWTFSPDLNQQVTNEDPIHPAGLRLTWQATPRNKLAFSSDFRERCACPNTAGGSTAVESSPDFIFRPDNVDMVTWSSPVTNRLLLEGTAVVLPLAWGNRINAGITPGLVQVVEQNPAPGTPGTYRGGGEYNWTQYPFRNVAFNATYVTGAHAFKGGWNMNWGYAHTHFTTTNDILSYRFSNGIPNQFTIASDPRENFVKVDHEIGMFVQDKWTVKRLTLSGGLRYDDMAQSAPTVTLGASTFTPARNVVFPDTQFKSFKDISPRMGAAFDLFGNGKTAIKVTLNRYVVDESLGSGTNRIVGSPQVYFQYTAARSWTDNNGNFFPDCNLTNPAAQSPSTTGSIDTCGAFTGANADFGRTSAGTIADHDVTFGWGHRGYNWEYSTSVQQELVPGKVALDVGYFRRWYGNFTVQDNLAVPASAYDTFSVTVPTNSALPNSGQTISGFLDINPAFASVPSNNVVELSNNYGKQTEYWHGVDLNMSARLGGGTLIQGGFSTGKQVTDNCEILAKVPEGGVTTQGGLNSQDNLLPISGALAVPYCHQEQPFLTQVKVLGTYTIPRIAVQVAAAYQDLPGPQILASVVYPNAVVSPSLGRSLSGSAANVTVNVVAPGTLYDVRLHQLDLRLGKVFRFSGGRRITPSIDVYNLFNSSAVLQEASTYSQFRTPTSVVGARLAKFTLVVAF